MHQHVLRVRQQYLGEAHPDTAEAHHNLGVAYGALRRLKDAEKHLQAAYQLRQKVENKRM